MSVKAIKKNTIEIIYNNKTSPNNKLYKKMIKELSHTQRALILNIFLFPQDPENPLDPNDMTQLNDKLASMVDFQNKYAFKRKNHIFATISRTFKNTFNHRISSDYFIAKMNTLGGIPNMTPLKPVNPICVDADLEAIVKPTEEEGIQLLTNLTEMILERGIYLNEGFFRIPGNAETIKQFQLELFLSCKSNQRAPKANEIEEIANDICGKLLDPDLISGVFKRIAMDLPTYETCDEIQTIGEIVRKYPDAVTKITRLFREIIDNEEITLMNGYALSAAFPSLNFIICS